MDEPRPFASKMLKESDVKHKLSLPANFLLVIDDPAFNQNISMEDDNGNNWDFGLRVRSGKCKKPVLSAGWRRFVKEKNVQAGRKVAFFKEKDEATGASNYKIKLEFDLNVDPLTRGNLS